MCVRMCNKKLDHLDYCLLRCFLSQIVGICIVYVCKEIIDNYSNI